MRATYVIALAIFIYVVGAWVHNKPVLSIKTVAAAVFLLIFIAVLDHPPTDQLATGLAWLVFAVAFLGANSPISGLANLIAGKSSATGLTKAQTAIGRGGPDTTGLPA